MQIINNFVFIACDLRICTGNICTVQFHYPKVTRTTSVQTLVLWVWGGANVCHVKFWAGLMSSGLISVSRISIVDSQFLPAMFDLLQSKFLVKSSDLSPFIHYSQIDTTYRRQTVISRTTRMLAINVSIPNRTVACLEQFRSPQLRIQRERPSDAGADWKQTLLYTKASCRHLPSESICS